MSSDEDDNDDCVFDTVMTLCQSSSSDDSSDDDEVPVDIVPPPPLVRGGSRPGKAANIDRKRQNVPEADNKNAENVRNGARSKEKRYRACLWYSTGALSHLDVWLSFVEPRCDEDGD